MKRLTIRLPGDVSADDAAIEWLIRDDGQAVADHGWTTRAALREVVAEHAPWADDPARVVVFIAAADLLMLACRVPGRNAAQIRRAAPYAIEEFVTEDIDAMHVAIGAIGRQAPVECLVAPKSSMEAWQRCLADAGIVAGFVTSDAMAIAAEAGAIAVVYDGAAALVRAPGQAASMDLGNLPNVLDALQAELEQNGELVLRQIGGAMSDLDLSQAGFAPQQVEPVALEGPVLAHLAETFDNAGAINLLQGEFAVRRRPSGTLAPWRGVAASFAAAAVLALAAMAAEGIWASHRAEALAGEAAALFRAIYDVERVQGDPARRMRARLGQTSASASGFHRLAGDLGLALQELPGGYELRSLSYSERRGLGAEVVVADYDTLERLQTSLVGRGLRRAVRAARARQSAAWRLNMRRFRVGRAIAEAWAAAGLRARYEALGQREQRLAIVAAAALGAALAYALAATVLESRQEAVERYTAKQADLEWMRRNEARAVRAAGDGASAANAQSQLSNINAAAKDFGLSLRRLQPDATGYTVQMEAAPFAKVIRWSHALEARHGIEIASVSIDVVEPGIVNARFNVR